jgi:hypothetical protein
MSIVRGYSHLPMCQPLEARHYSHLGTKPNMSLSIDSYFILYQASLISSSSSVLLLDYLPAKSCFIHAQTVSMGLRSGD